VTKQPTPQLSERRRTVDKSANTYVAQMLEWDRKETRKWRGSQGSGKEWHSGTENGRCKGRASGEELRLICLEHRDGWR
jgi:hypothetical protein